MISVSFKGLVPDEHLDLAFFLYAGKKQKKTKTPPHNEDACLQDERTQEEDKKIKSRILVNRQTSTG